MTTLQPKSTIYREFLASLSIESCVQRLDRLANCSTSVDLYATSARTYHFCIRIEKSSGKTAFGLTADGVLEVLDAHSTRVILFPMSVAMESPIPLPTLGLGSLLLLLAGLTLKIPLVVLCLLLVSAGLMIAYVRTQRVHQQMMASIRSALDVQPRLRWLAGLGSRNNIAIGEPRS